MGMGAVRVPREFRDSPERETTVIIPACIVPVLQHCRSDAAVGLPTVPLSTS